MDKTKDQVICIYDDNAPTINEKILDAFIRYIKSI